MRKPFLLLALAVCCMAGAQVLDVRSVERVVLPASVDARDCKVAGISPDGSYLLLTGSTNRGLSRYDLRSGELTTLSTSQGAGYGVQVSDDGRDVLYRETVFGADRLRRSRLVRRSFDTSKSEELVPLSRNLEGYTIKSGAIYAVDNKRMHVRSLKGKNQAEVEGKQEEKTVMQASVPVVSIRDGQLMLTVNGNTRVFSPNGTDKSYLWPSVSPDGKHVCYYVGGVGCYVVDIDGKHVQLLARQLRAARWYDNSTVVGMADEDNGEYVTASAIVAYTLTGKSQRLTDTSLIAMYPYPTADGSKIVFSTPQGEAYLIHIRK